MTIAWTDVTGWQTLWVPDDADAIQTAVVAQLEDAHAKGATIFSNQYGFTVQAIADAMAIAGAANPANRYCFDESEYFGTYEKPIVDGLIAKLQPDQWGIGTSSVGGQILHAKVLAILYPDGTGWTFSGSYNLSTSAMKQLNVADLIWSRQRAESFAAQIQKALSWVQANHQPQPPVSPSRVGVALDDGGEGIEHDSNDPPSTESE